MQKQNESVLAVLLGAGAYVLWGVMPLYWKMAGDVSSAEVLAYRIIWAFVFMVLALVLMGKLTEVLREMKVVWQNKKSLIAITAASVLITANWFIFIFAVNSDRIIDASLGYYINPLMNVLLATIILKEQLTKLEKSAVALAFVGVVILTLYYGHVPWASLLLATTFCTYGFIKRSVPIRPWTGLTVETLLMAPFALVFLYFLPEASYFSESTTTMLVLAGTGIITAVPLLLFAAAAQKLSFTVIGFLQYIAPTFMLIIGVFIYHEPFSNVQLAAFICIWTALSLFTYSKLNTRRRLKKLAKTQMPA
ncbi:EamA family transporter RarD [Alkalicoccobacillus murimartini]|uniref:Chloramphenicol-sensitive protein RarD n=1 Tax=Alkalicoccobacillus murimartini TaxID=171685 RepID=A0ABT9YJC9_9BACI|nr:EamA family transporter RarD [Alkalicoccobacillus murimartini]MDQ0207789.1 chloramphenicol-sensitive protein RarD [Alkalicoccobacillus murimartini]